MLTDRMKHLGLRSLKYLFFLTAVMTWMIVLGPKETLTVDEQVYLQDFVAQAEQEVAPPQSQVAADVPVASGIQYGIVLEDGLKVRSGPGTEYAAIMMLYRNNEVQLLELDPTGWWKILINGSEYYVKSEYIAQRSITGQQ